MVSPGTRDLEQAKRLERGLVRVRWFAAVLGVYLISQTNSAAPPFASTKVVALGYTLMAGLAAGNAVIWWLSARASTVRRLNAIGMGAFGLDAVVVFALSWLYSYDPFGTVWVVLYVLPLEGAIRYRLHGALATVGATFVSELLREVYLSLRFRHPGINGGAFEEAYHFYIANVMFRVGIDAIIGLVAGFMARSMAREAERAAEQAYRFESLARREAATRSELAAFNTAILTGLAAEDLDSSLRLMADAVGRDLGFESFTIMLREGDELLVKGVYGLPFSEDRIPLGIGVTGTVAATGRPLIVPEVSEFENYVQTDPAVRSEMAVPLRIGEELAGVLDVEDRRPAAFDEDDVAMLTRLADQIALVAHSNRLLSQQSETVARLQELDQMKSDFVAITSHELRTPITAIRGFVKTLLRNRDRLSDEQLASFMQTIDRQSDRLAGLVEDLLFVSKIEAGTIRLEMRPVELETFLRDAVESMGLEARSRVVVEVSPPGAARVVIDPQRVEQVVRNLVGNSLKFSPPDSSVEVRARLGDGDRSIEISVSDHGVGIAPEELPRIFDRFHQAGEVLRRENEGAGLGLYITKRLTEAMGGTISVASAPGQGSTFRVLIPNGEAALARQRQAEEIDQAGRGDGSDTGSKAAARSSEKAATSSGT